MSVRMRLFLLSPTLFHHRNVVCSADSAGLIIIRYILLMQSVHKENISEILPATLWQAFATLHSVLGIEII